MSNLTTIDSIMATVKDALQRGIPLSPGILLEYCTTLVVLLQDLDEKLILAEMEYRELMAKLIEEGSTAASAEVKAKASFPYKTYLMLKSRREQVEAFVSIIKKRASLPEWGQ